MIIPIQQAKVFAQSGKFIEMLALCEQIVNAHADNSDVLLEMGVLLKNFGFITRAEECFKRVLVLIPDDLSSLLNLANIAHDKGCHAESKHLYSTLQDRFLNNPVIRRNALVSLEYDSKASGSERFNMALAWGEWAVAIAGGVKLRPELRGLNSCQQKIGDRPRFSLHLTERIIS